MQVWYVVGAIAAVVLLIPSSLIYTDKWPWQIAAALNDQRDAYATLADQLAETEGARGPFALVRAVAAPFTFCVLPMAVIYWPRLSGKNRFLAILVVLVSIDFSILRGTTRELADLAVIAMSALLVSLGRTSVSTGANFSTAIGRHWKALALAPLLVFAVTVSLIGRTEARLGGKNSICLADSGACVTNEQPYASMSDATFFGLATVSGYLGQGYYGLTLTANKPFDSTLGVGHSPAVGALFLMLGGNKEHLDRAYTARAERDGWSDATQWSTLLSWISNDIGLAGALFFVVILGALWGRAWINATHGNDDRSAVYFCAIMMMIFYLPANNQMMGSFDNYFTLVFWFVVAMFGRKTPAPAS